MKMFSLSLSILEKWKLVEEKRTEGEVEIKKERHLVRVAVTLKHSVKTCLIINLMSFKRQIASQRLIL